MVSAHAAVLTFNLTESINGATPAATDITPWLTATFTDTTANHVQLTLKNNLVNATTNTPTGEFVVDWLFNSNVLPITASYVSGFKATFLLGDTNGGSNVQAGIFDMNFACSSDNCSGNDPRFTGGMTSVFDLSATGLSATSFLTTSSADGKQIAGGYYTAADIRGITVGNSGSIGTKDGKITPTGDPVPVPEPMPLVLLGMGLAAFSLSRMKKKAS